jgi:ankyrin repeat protein
MAGMRPRHLRTVVLSAVLLLSGCQGVGDTSPAAAPKDSSAPRATAPATPTKPPSPPTARRSTQPTRTPKETSRLERLDQAALDARLITAAWDNDVDRARRLIEAGADVNAKDETEQSAYLISTSEGYLPLLNLTLRNGADVHSLDRFNGTGLIRAAERGHADIVGRLLRTDIRVNHVNRLGWTAMHEAIILGDGSQRYVDTVRLLVAGGADPSLPDGDGVTPLQHARSRGFEEIAMLLRRA